VVAGGAPGTVGTEGRVTGGSGPAPSGSTTGDVGDVVEVGDVGDVVEVGDVGEVGLVVSNGLVVVVGVVVVVV
jgi:hypothetical protein